MPSTTSYGKFQFDFSPATAARPRDPDEPFRILLVADLAGRPTRGLNVQLQGRKPISIDTDNFQQVFNRVQPTVRLNGPPWPGGSLELSFSAPEDFHPDSLLKLAPLSEWLEVRKRLLNPASASGAVSDVNRLLGRLPASSPEGGVATAKSGNAPAETTGDTLARLMGTPVSSGSHPTPPAASPAASVDALIRSIISPSNVPAPTSEQSVCLQALDEELSRRLRMALHDPGFRQCEANWRGVEMIVRDFGGEEEIKISVLDVSRPELEADLCSQSDLGATGLFRGLRDVSWGAVLAAYSFSDTLVDFEWLGRLAKIGEALRVPIVGSAHERLIGCSSLAMTPDPDDWQAPLRGDLLEVWNALRRRAETRYLGLALPRVLMRLPYGKGHDEIDSFPFEELDATRPHESYLWGNPAFACGHVIAQAFQSDGWDLSLSGMGEVNELPVHRFVEDGSTQVKPCAEAWLSDRAAERLEDGGFIAIQSVKNRDAIRVANLRSLSSVDSSFATA